MEPPSLLEGRAYVSVPSSINGFLILFLIASLDLAGVIFFLPGIWTFIGLLCFSFATSSRCELLVNYLRAIADIYECWELIEL